MKRFVTRWLPLMIFIFGTCPLYAASSLNIARGLKGFFIWKRFADKYNWPRWIVVVLAIILIVGALNAIIENAEGNRKKQASSPTDCNTQKNSSAGEGEERFKEESGKKNRD